MALDAAHELEGLPPGSRAAAVAPATSAIVAERTAVRLDPLFALAAALLAATVTGVGILLAARGDATAAESAAAPLAFGLSDAFGVTAARMASAVAAGVATLGVAFAGRSLGRSGTAGIIAATLLALDPSFLAYARLAVPTAFVLAGLALTLALCSAARPWAPWAATIPYALAVAVDPRALLWSPVLVALVVLRGHIYASPRHLALAATQLGLVPAMGALLHLALEGGWRATPACLAPPASLQLALVALVQPGASIAAVPNPITWIAGAGVVLVLGLGAVAFAAARFRLARANGRVQARLVAPLPPVLGRGAWLLLLAAATLVPQAWLLLFCLALAIGVQHLGEDAPGFGLSLAGVLVLFGALVLVRAWQAVSGAGGPDGVADAVSLVPWGRAAAC